MLEKLQLLTIGNNHAVTGIEFNELYVTITCTFMNVGRWSTTTVTVPSEVLKAGDPIKAAELIAAKKNLVNAKHRVAAAHYDIDAVRDVILLSKQVERLSNDIK